MKKKPAIIFDKVTKRYYKGGRYQPTLREWLGTIVGGTPFQRPEFLCLDEVSFTVARGKVLGIVGSNGAGKSTILKIIARVTYPNNGKVIVNGDVGGVLALGTGFHPELTGHENVYLSGAIMGFSKNKVDRIYNKVVGFSGLRDFMDTPIKHYSSGMMARLGFSVAIHIQPEILLIDEILAVGDISFRKKCLAFMKSYCKDPKRTVLFVSHSEGSIKSLCDHVLWLEKGKIIMQGSTTKVLPQYLKTQEDKGDNHVV